MLCITQMINYLIFLSDISSHPGPFSILIEVTCSSLTSWTLVSFLLSIETVLFLLFSLHQNMVPSVTQSPDHLPWPPFHLLFPFLITLDTPVKLLSSKLGSQQPCATLWAWGGVAGKLPGRKGCGAAGRQLAGHESAVCPGGQEGQWHPGFYQEWCGQQE